MTKLPKPELMERDRLRKLESRRAAGAKPRPQFSDDAERKAAAAQRLKAWRERKRAEKKSASQTPGAISGTSTNNFESIPLGIKVSQAVYSAIEPLPALLANLPVEDINKVRQAVENIVAKRQAAKPVKTAANVVIDERGVKRYPAKAKAAKEREHRKFIEERPERYQLDLDRIKTKEAAIESTRERIVEKLVDMKSTKAVVEAAPVEQVLEPVEEVVEEIVDEWTAFAAELDVAVASVPKPNINPRDLVDEIMREKMMRKQLGL